MLDETDRTLAEDHGVAQSAQPDRPKPFDARRTIDRIGVARIASALQISEQAVRQWRGRNQIPESRVDTVLALLEGSAEFIELAEETEHAPAAPACATKGVSRPGDQLAEETELAPAVTACATKEVSRPGDQLAEETELAPAATACATKEVSRPGDQLAEETEHAPEGTACATKEVSRPGDQLAEETELAPAAPACATKEVSRPGDQLAEETELAPAVTACATKEVSETSAGETPQPVSVTKLPEQLDPAELQGSSARKAMALFIANRDVDMMRAIADKAADDAQGLPPVSPVRWYCLRLTILFALDFPILTMAFVTVTEASPILAAGSAIALSLGLVLCAHVAGAQLRSLSAYIPDWLRSMATLIIMVSLIAAVIGIAAELRHKGFEVEGLALATDAAGIFAPTTELPDSLKSAIVRAAGLVTLLLTVFGIAWSYSNHGPQQAFAVAEKAYRKALKRYASAVRRSATSPRHLSAAVLIAAAVTLPDGQASAADCGGPSILTLVDTTTAFDDLDRDGLVPAIDAMARSLQPDDRLIIRTLRDAPNSSRLLLDICVPGRRPFEWSAQGLWNWLSTSPAAHRAEQAHLKRSIREAVLLVLTQQREASGTALVDTLSHFVAIDRPNTVWLLSDLLESVALTTSSLLSASESLVTVRELGPSMSGVDVHAAGFGRFHDRDRRMLTSAELGTLLDAWTTVIRMSGGELHLVHPASTSSQTSGLQR